VKPWICTLTLLSRTWNRDGQYPPNNHGLEPP
jgi:hypothetical protein